MFGKDKGESKVQLEVFRKAFLAFIDSLKANGVDTSDRNKVLLFALMAAGFCLPERIDKMDPVMFAKIARAGMSVGSAVFTWVASEGDITEVNEMLENILNEKDIKNIPYESGPGLDFFK